MTWLYLIRLVAPYAIIFVVGFGAAWKLQGVRVDALKLDVKEEAQKLIDYKTDQHRLKMAAEAEAEQRRKETAHDYQKKIDRLAQDHDIYRRCVAAGKCGAVRVPILPGSSSCGVSPAGRLDADRPDTVPAAGEPAAEAEVLRDCARTTLQLNQLQSDIEKQGSK